MAITSKGYSGTIDYADWAVLSDRLGAQYSVFGADDFRASAGVGDRVVNIIAGSASGAGIFDVSDETVPLTGAPVGAGDRWDMIALRRDWNASGGDGVSTPVLIQGGTAKALPSVDGVSRFAEPGDVDDQPLWLARFTAGQTAVQELVDLRCWHGSGGMVARDLLARDYLNRIGTRVWIQGITWVLGFNSSGTPTWVTDSVWTSATQPPYFEGLGWLKPVA
jgi:hypothetical protein